MMLIAGFKNILLLALFGALALSFSGCADLAGQVPAQPLSLTRAEQTKLSAATEPRLVQMLGGFYYDQSVAEDLTRLCLKEYQAADSCKISVADLSASALYPLPSGRIVLTRGLLAEVNSTAELLSLLGKAVSLSRQFYADHATRDMNQLIEELLSGPVLQYDPDSADIRLARLFKEKACEKSCLELNRVSVNAGTGVVPLPDSVTRIVALQPGYELLGKARNFEEQGDQRQAVATYLQAATATPDEPRILRALGMAYLRAGQMQSARLYLQKAVQLQPNYYRSLMGLGYLYLKMGKLDQASQSLAESVALLPVTENLFLLAETREKRGDLKGALMLYKLIVESDPDSKLGHSSARRLAQRAGGQ